MFLLTRGLVYSAREAQMGPFISNNERELSYIGETPHVRIGQYRGNPDSIGDTVETTR